MNISICIATYGSDVWAWKARQQALPSAEAQGAHEVLIRHEPDGTRQSSRNALGFEATGDWLLFLDADDDLMPGFVDEMKAAYKNLTENMTPNGRVLLTPAVAYTKPGLHKHRPALIPKCDISTGNWLILGTLLERELFVEVGGFSDWNARTGNEFDDWELWIRCHKAGATVVQVPNAVYIHRVERNSKHRRARHATRLQWHFEIGQQHYPEQYPDTWGQPQRLRARN